MFTISVATEEDVPDIISLAEKTWWTAYGSILSHEQIVYMLHTLYHPRTLRDEIKQGTFLILQESGGPQGFAAYAPRAEDPTIVKLHKLYVTPERQRRGYGRALLDDVTGRLRRENLHTLELNVNRYNSARHFYEQYGFRVIREEDIPIGPYWMNDYVMRLKC